MPGSFTRNIITTIAFLGLTACGGSSGGTSSGATPPSVPPPPPTSTSTSFTLRGAAFKGLLLGANVYVYSADELFDDNPVAIAEGQISSSTGNFSISVDTAGQNIGDNIVVAVVMKNSNMICDAAKGCGANIEFGDEFSLPRESLSNESRLGDPFFLSAILPTPNRGETREMIVNMFTHMQLVYFNQLLVSSSFPNEQLLLERSQTRVAKLFGLNDSDFTQLQFANIAANGLYDTDPNSARAEIISGGILASLLEGTFTIDEAFFNLLSDFVNQDGELLINEGNSDSQNRISLQDIFENALLIGGDDVKPTTNNGFDSVLQGLEDSKRAVDEARDFSFTFNGEF